LSVDTLVWPSVFDSGQGIGLDPAARSRLGLAGVPLPGYIGPNAGLWQDRAGMLRHLAEHGQAQRSAPIIAITWLSDQGFLEAGPFGPHVLATDPVANRADDPLMSKVEAESADQPEAWTLLGFDVADGGLLSGLSNCGYTIDERTPMRERWAALLNDHHLFADAAPAFKFRTLTDQRVLAHAPFFVNGLYIVGPAYLPLASRLAAHGTSTPETSLTI
jgi:hypothetical protein